MARRSSCANQLSTAFSHEALVGVKWKWTRGCRSSHASTAGVVCVLLLSRMRWRSSSAGVVRSICRKKARILSRGVGW